MIPCWKTPECVHEMNRFFDKHHKDLEVQKHLFTFVKLLDLTDQKGSNLLDLGCGTGLLSEFCKEYNYHGADLSHILSGCAMRNYPQYLYKACDIEKDYLKWIESYPVIVMNAVLDVMEHPITILTKILLSASQYVIIHRQEITEQGSTRVIQKPSYNGFTHHSIISRKDLNELLELYNFDIVKELPLEFADWEGGGRSFLLRKRKSWSLHKIDHILNMHIGHIQKGFFIEAGANDGLRQSNSYFFEFYKDWSGLLIEPIPELAEKCKENRSTKTKIINAALVGPDHASGHIEILYTPACYGLMSAINDQNAANRMNVAGEPGEKIKVPAGTLSKYLSSLQIKHVDILMLDVEGYELNVLKGIDFDQVIIDYMLIEELGGRQDIHEFLQQKGYERIEAITHHDHLYKKNNENHL